MIIPHVADFKHKDQNSLKLIQNQSSKSKQQPNLGLLSLAEQEVLRLGPPCSKQLSIKNNISKNDL